MGLDLNSVIGNSAETEIEFMGATAKVVYRPSVLTADRLIAVDTSGDAFFEFFTELVADWDVKKGKTKVPLTTKALKQVPLPFLRSVFFQVMTAAASGEAGGLSNAS